MKELVSGVYDVIFTRSIKKYENSPLMGEPVTGESIFQSAPSEARMLEDLMENVKVSTVLIRRCIFKKIHPILEL